ncbi:3880_t:CDS:2 [Acaulospora colombiana]|uniref:3880_t:CDS:1 n=1 Tax=Acaulospora colombiana TaxID=27376 RepID=A0ACA9NYN0_9GLOM|nr:3880_t:CDS:2 [Acaulospora colombiana]
MSQFEGQVPGGVLKTVVEEHQFMDEFIQLLKRRNRDLATLYESFSPKWKDSAIYPLLSPILSFFKSVILSEMTIRRTTCEPIKTILDEIPVTDPPDALEEDGVSILDDYQKLIEVNERLEECREKANSSDSVTMLREWLNNEAPKSQYGDTDHFTNITELNRKETARFILPEPAHKVSNWHGSVLLVTMINIYQRNTLRFDVQDVLERHQGLSENIKKVLQKAKDRLNAFSSVDYIAPKHEGQSLESSHEFMKVASYVNSVTGKSTSVIVYGVELGQVKFMDALRRNIEKLPEVCGSCSGSRRSGDVIGTLEWI